ncbi:Alpha/Beta hydrolase protein [Phyllosticta citriasiana]|uniref:Alpha/Beta hydrolase protein n=1 Tax=Phyllosticta citriasiana TaxID=595635 RepID=A0ABR1KV66_9PEZI
MAQDASSKPTHPSFFGSSSSSGGGGGGGGGPQSTITTTTPPTEPEPFVIPPSHPTGRHTHTLIVLHGRGDTGPQFGSGLIGARTSLSTTTTTSNNNNNNNNNNNTKRLIDHLRTTRLVFPTAPHVSPTTGLTQWYENFSLADPTQRKEAQRAGLAATGALLARLARREARLVGGLDRVVIGGLSQGCAAALVFFLGFHDEEEEEEGSDEALGGFFGFSGWLPFADELDPAARWEMGSDERVAAGGDEEKDEDEEWMSRRQTKAASIARTVASLPPLRLEPGESPAFARTPVFLGHGRRDRHVEMRLGAQAGDVLVDLGCDVRWEEYDEEHWWKEPEQIDDLVEFLRDAVGVEVT